jgi:zinc protease
MVDLIAITNPANMGQVEATIAEELKKFLADGVTAEELAAAQKVSREALKMALADDAGLTMDLTDGLYLGRTFRHDAESLKKVEALTPADVRKAFQRVVDPSKLVIVTAGDFGKVTAGKGETKAQP